MSGYLSSKTTTARPVVRLLMFNLNVHELNLLSNFQRALIFANLVIKFIVAHTARQKFEGRCKRLNLSKKAIFKFIQTLFPDRVLLAKRLSPERQYFVLKEVVKQNCVQLDCHSVKVY